MKNLWIIAFVAVLAAAAYTGALMKETYVNGTSNKTIDDIGNRLNRLIESSNNMTDAFSWQFNTTAEMDFGDRFIQRTKNVAGAFGVFITRIVFETAILSIEYGWYHLTAVQGKKIIEHALLIIYIIVAIMALPALFYIIALIVIIFMAIKNWLVRKNGKKTNNLQKLQ
jgi:hypothetical protein